MTKPQKIEGGWEQATKNALPEMKWRQDLMLMIYEVGVTKKMLASDLIDKIIKHEDEAKASERQRCVEEVEKINRIVGNIYKINKDDHNRLDKDLLYLAGETSNLLKKLDQAKYNLEQIK